VRTRRFTENEHSIAQLEAVLGASCEQLQACLAAARCPIRAYVGPPCVAQAEVERSAQTSSAHANAHMRRPVAGRFYFSRCIIDPWLVVSILAAASSTRGWSFLF
jgi:hypothetical protein